MCKIYLSSFQGIEETNESVKGLTSAGGFIRSELFHRPKMPKSTELSFIADTSRVRSTEISKKLSDLID